MQRRIEWPRSVNKESVQHIDHQATPELLQMATMFAQVAAEKMFNQAKENCAKHQEECLPFQNFLEVAFREKLREMLGIKTGSLESFAYNEWYSTHRRDLQAYLD